MRPVFFGEFEMLDSHLIAKGSPQDFVAGDDQRPFGQKMNVPFSALAYFLRPLADETWWDMQA